MEKSNLVTGQTDPYEIEKFQKRGVSIYSKVGLHSKVYVFDNKAIICSANISANSEKNLIECGFVSDDIKAVKDAIKFVKNNCERQVDDAYIDLCKQDFIPNNFVNKNAAKNDNEIRYWILSTEEADFFNEDEQIELDNTRPDFAKKLKNKASYTIDDYLLNQANDIYKYAKYGDYLIEIFHTGRNIQVYKPKLILGKSYFIEFQNNYLRVAVPKNIKPFQWKLFKAFLSKNKIYQISKTSKREIKGQTLKVVQDFFK